uniref:Rab3GAP regulatory subunit C-terminal domain-containing protein n=1 Tax=Trichuris muris TaxID=70415 RepID=A0A5S6QDC7_TRIMR
MTVFFFFDVVEEDILFDDRRIGRQLIFAPGNSNLVAVSDSLGRITLWDLRQKLCIHVWKGYRDAQFGWMQVTDKKGNSSKGKQSPAVLVLAIFAPRLAVLQLWLVRRCQKIAVFKVDPHSRLLYTPPLWINKSCVGDHCSPVCLLDSSGNVFSPIVSLASCLNEDRRHSFWTPELRKHFKEQWRNELVSKEQLDGLIEMILSIHRVDDFETFMDKVFSNAKNLDCRLTCTLLESIVRRCEATAGEEEGLDLVGRRCQCMIQVVNFYAVIAALGEETHAGLVGESEFCSPLDPAVIQALNEKLSNILSLRNPDTEGTVLTLPQFLGMFTYDASGPVLKSDLSSESLASAGSFVFTPFFTRLPAHRFGRHYRTLLPLPAASWVLLLCSFWLDSVRSYSVSAEQFLCHLTGLICNQEDSEHLLDIIYKSVLSTHRIPEAVCLSEFVTAFCVSLLDSDGTVNESWETIDRRVVCWTAVCKVLRGMYVLQEFISVCKSVDQSAPRNTSEEDISLRNVLQASSDFFVEMFCRYFSLINPPASFLQTDGNEWWRPTLASLKQQFPFQFSSDSLLLNLAWQTASQWHFCFANVQLLSSVLQHLRSLSTARLRHCSSNLIWKTYCCHIARSFFCFDSEFFDKRVLEQRGRSIPFCLYQLITFCLDSLVQCDGNCAEAPQVPCEDFLYTFMCTNGKLKLAKTLLDRTNELPLANKRNVELHRQLLLTLLCACDSHSYSLGSCSALLELFPERFRGVFFKDMSVSISENEQSFAAVRQPRVSYLKALNADFVEAAPLGTIPNVELLLELCIAWDIDYDILRRQTIVLMLCNGDSQTAFQLLDVVEDHNAMADEFFQLACQFVLCRSLDGDIEISASMRSHLSSKVDRDSLKRTLSKKLTVDILERLVAYVDEVTPSDWNNGAVLNYVKKSLGNLAGR